MLSRPWKLLPLAAIVALMALVLVPGGGVTPPSAFATVGIVGEDDVDGEMTFEVQIDADEGDVDITVDGGADTTDLTLTIDDCDGEDGNGCEEGESDDGDADAGVTVTVDSDEITGDITITLTLEADCEDDDTLTITVSSDEDDDTATVDCLAGGGGSASGNVIAILDGDDVDVDFEISGTSSECDDSFTLTGGDDEEGFDCDSPGDYTLEATLPSGSSIDSIDCDTEGDADVTIDEDEGTVDIELNEVDDAVECTFNVEGGGTGTDGGNVSSVTVSAGPNSVNCSGSSFITIVVKNAQGGNVADGTSVSVSTNLGSVNPTNATTQGGGVLILYTGPSNQGGNATVTATAGGVTSTTQVAVNCNQAPAPTNPPPPPAGQGGGIQPPNTGDAGLADNGSGFGYAGLAFIASVLLGTIAFARVRA